MEIREKISNKKIYVEGKKIPAKEKDKKIKENKSKIPAFFR
jgi:hypothetical protein